MHRTSARAASGIIAATAIALLLIAGCTDSPRAGVTPPESVTLAPGAASAVQTVTVSPASATRDPGQTVQLTATARNRKGGVVTGVTFTWSSSAPAIATVSSTGLVAAIAPGTATISATGGGKTGTSTITVPAPPPPPGSETIVAAGDIAQCNNSNDEATALLVDNIPGTVAVLGDNAYENGSSTDYSNCYDPSWGRHKARTKPSVGNHEYQTTNATGYYGYFGAAAGDPAKGYYSYDLGAWHIVVLNSNCTIVSCAAGSAQEQWLRADLAGSTKACTLAYFHHPRFNSGASHGNSTSVAPFWDALYQFGAEVILNGHEHLYERFAPQTPAAASDPTNGIRQFTVGTGGRSFYSIGAIQPNSQVINNATYGVLRLTLGAGTYSWQFHPVAGQTFTDTGTGSCH
jgi:acid phosphatase type 7